jgi:squalene monooxygenase
VPNVRNTDIGSSLVPSPALLFRHFFAVAFYSIWVMFTHPRRVSAPSLAEKANGQVEVWVTPGVLEYPALFIKAIQVVRLVLGLTALIG